MLITLNYYIWRLFIPRIKEEYFQSKLFSIVSILYISIYNMPRKLFIHYFLGKGECVTVDTKKVIVNNPVVHNNLICFIQNENANDKNQGFINIPQIDVFNPNYRYSIGSFRIYYSISNDVCEIKISSSYSYKHNSDRITKYLHNWLCSFKEKGYAREFEITGIPWNIKLSALRNSKIKFDKYSIILNDYQWVKYFW